MRKITFTCLAVLAMAGSPRLSFGDPQALSLVINPRTGAASIRNDTASSINIDGYLITSAQPAARTTRSKRPAGVLVNTNRPSASVRATC